MTVAPRLSTYQSGRGPILLLLHGIGSSRTAWSRQIARLEDSFMCIAPDLPGYGDSPDPAEPGLDSIVQSVAGVLGQQAAHVVGVSFGALVSLALACRYPPLVRSLVLADATLGRAGDPHEARDRWLAHRCALAQGLSVRSLERAREIAAPEAPHEVVEDIAAHMRRARPAGYLAVAKAIAATNALPWLSAIHQPALVVYGEHDGVTGLAVSQTLAESLPNAQLINISGAGHAPHIERPDHFAGAIRKFLGNGS
jgi:3-oxoadipate enol-lactonase